MKDLTFREDDRALILGATGFIGTRLVRELAARDIKLRLLVRNPGWASGLLQKGRDIEVVKGDLLANQGLDEALRGIHSAFYLVHSLGGKIIGRNTEFAEKDKAAAEYFVQAAGSEGLKRAIYLGWLGEAGGGLSDHLKSRAEVAGILSSGPMLATVLRAAVVIFRIKIVVTHGKVHDVMVLDDLIIEAGAIYIMDRGYLDFARLHRIHRASAFFVTRSYLQHTANLCFGGLITIGRPI